MEEPPKFIADEMNGDLARWLRIMGFDCLYITGKNIDNILLEKTLSTDRILLTGDKELFRKVIKRGGKAIYTQGRSLEEKFESIIEKIDLSKWIGKLPYRCSICNEVLIKIKPEDLDDTPEYVRERYEYIWYCKNCNKIYWEGSHWKKIKEMVKCIKSLAKRK